MPSASINPTLHENEYDRCAFTSMFGTFFLKFAAQVESVEMKMVGIIQRAASAVKRKKIEKEKERIDRSSISAKRERKKIIVAFVFWLRSCLRI